MSEPSINLKAKIDGKEVELTRVTSWGSLSITIPEEVTYMNRKYKLNQK